MKDLISKLRRRLAYWRWHRNLRTSVMPLGHGAVAVVSGFLGGQPMIVMIPVPNDHIGEPGSDATNVFSFEGMRGIEDLPRGSVVLAFKDKDALWRHRTVVHQLWAETVNGKGEPA